jgi:hypothetical protein
VVGIIISHRPQLKTINKGTFGGVVPWIFLYVIIFGRVSEIALQAAEAGAAVPVLPLRAPRAAEDQGQASGQAGGPVDQSGHNQARGELLKGQSNQRIKARLLARQVAQWTSQDTTKSGVSY